MLWIVLVGGLVFMLVAATRSASPQARRGWLAGVVALVGLIAAARFGPGTLLVAAPLSAWLIWSARQGSPRPRHAPSPRGQGMTRDEALRVLGLSEGASREAVAAAHRTLIKKLHPDRGGSGFLAQQVNEAKKVLDAT